MLVLMFWWIGLVVVCLSLVIGRGIQGGALTLAYFGALSLIHVPGALAFLGSSPNVATFDDSYVGFRATVIGLTAFLVGALVVNKVRKKKSQSDGYPRRSLQGLSVLLFAIGTSIYFLLLPIAYLLPSASALLGGASAVIPFALWCYAYHHLEQGAIRKIWLVVLILPLLPVATMIQQGFIGYGVNWIIAVMAMIYVCWKKKSHWIILGPVLSYVALSFFVSYFEGRAELRETVWFQQSTIGERLELIWKMAKHSSLLDINNADHAEALSERLNQNFLVGVGISRHQAGQARVDPGSTLPVWMFVPRALWPEKPAVGGSGSVVSEFTGLQFAEGTSVGVGQVLEFYINFSWYGILVGFFLLGFLLKWLDWSLMLAFRQRNLPRMLKLGPPGLILLQPGGSLMEVLVALVGAVCFSLGIIYVLRWLMLQRRHNPPELLTDD